MAVDVSVTFVGDVIQIEEIALFFLEFLDHHSQNGLEIYLVIGYLNSDLPTNLTFFGIWSNQSFDLNNILTRLGKDKKVCSIWKSEHAGSAGFKIWENGRKIADVSSNEDYLSIPVSGVSRAFGINPEEEDIFPEVLINEENCQVIKLVSNLYELCPIETIQMIFEYEIDLEPAYP